MIASGVPRGSIIDVRLEEDCMIEEFAWLCLAVLLVVKSAAIVSSVCGVNADSKGLLHSLELCNSFTR